MNAIQQQAIRTPKLQALAIEAIDSINILALPIWSWEREQRQALVASIASTSGLGCLITDRPVDA